MASFFNIYRTRYTAIVMVFVWLMTLGIGIANACLVDGARGHPTLAAQVHVTHHEHADEQPVASDKAVCFSVCESEQAATVKIKVVDVPSSMQTAPVTCFPALTVMVVDPNDRSTLPVRAPWCELPASIRFLRLTI